MTPRINFSRTYTKFSPNQKMHLKYESCLKDNGSRISKRTAAYRYLLKTKVNKGCLFLVYQETCVHSHNYLLKIWDGLGSWSVVEGNYGISLPQRNRNAIISLCTKPSIAIKREYILFIMIKQYCGNLASNKSYSMWNRNRKLVVKGKKLQKTQTLGIFSEK